MPKFLKIFAFALVSFCASIIISKPAKALTFEYPRYDVEININQDTSFDVKETATYKFFGDVHGLRRDVTLDDPSRCASRTDVTCGGFDRIIVLGVYNENGKKLDDGDYKIYEYDDVGARYLRFERELWPDGKTFNGEEVTWSVEYRILGGIRWIGKTPYFYWNVLPENRNGNVTSSTVRINFPENITLKQNMLKVYTGYEYTINFDDRNNSVVLKMSNLSSFGPVTVSYGFDEDDLTKPGVLKYKVIKPTSGVIVYLDGAKFSESREDTINWFPTGDHTLSFKRFGYKTKEVEVNIKEGEEKYIEVELQIEPWMQFLLVCNWIIICFGFLTVPLALFFVYRRYQKKGRDIKMPKTIIPLYSPPKNVHPYLLGTIKDERVDKQDIVGSIIDLAYRGYIKIKEVKKGKEYELTKLSGKKGDEGLNETEQKIFDALFNGQDVRSTKNLSTYFPQKYVEIQNKIYQELVDKGFFSKSPQTVRGSYAAAGAGILGLGIAALIGISMLEASLLGIFTVFTPAFALIVIGLGYLVIANFMPSKTESGSRTFADILGFKMYLHTAERYRLQDLGPEEFERYLSYAVVFGIEKEWAEKFKDIYNKVPDWYEGQTPGVYDALWVSTFTRSFANTTVTNMTPVSSGSSRGGGWSGGGGSFGGFSGGGGGGGGSGAW